MVELTVIIVLLLALVVWERYQHRQQLIILAEGAAKERRTLEDRLMALTQPQALTHARALEEPLPGTVNYVDEEPGTDTIQRGRVEYATEA